ncbi:MAG: thiamine-phosphate kinase [Myxococcota bacterium]
MIARLLASRAAPGAWLTVDAGDDAAVLHGQAVSTDTLVQGTHFDDRLSPEDIGYKAIAVSVSDVVAMGGAPQWALLALTLPRHVDPTVFVDGLAQGVTEACGRFGVRLVGGDVTGGRGPRVVTTVVAGPCPRPVTRTGARAGDDVWVTGTLGLAGAGWMWEHPPEPALQALRRPTPPLAFAAVLAEHASAAMDLSDGLATDLPRLTEASGVAVHLDLGLLPMPEVLQPATADEVRSCQLTGGEDYQLLFTAAPELRDTLAAQGRAVGIQVTRIGTVMRGRGVTTSEGPLPAPEFAHFAGSRGGPP